VSVSGDGNTAIVGGSLDNHEVGAAWVFTQQPLFAGTPGMANCIGQSVAALAQQYGELNAAAAALPFDSAGPLQGAIQEFCEAQQQVGQSHSPGRYRHHWKGAGVALDNRLYHFRLAFSSRSCAFSPTRSIGR
jgi:hypothetical protein